MGSYPYFKACEALFFLIIFILVSFFSKTQASVLQSNQNVRAVSYIVSRIKGIYHTLHDFKEYTIVVDVFIQVKWCHVKE